MSEERRQILQMLGEGKISTDEAERLLEALERGENERSTTAAADDSGRRVATAEPVSQGKKPRFLHVRVRSKSGSGKHDNVDIKVPLMLLKAGVKLGSMMPEHARGKLHGHLADKGFDFDLNQLDSEKLDVLVQALTETSIDIDADDETVQIFCA